MATYGEEKVRKALDAGAVDLMLVTSSIDENKIEELAKIVENQSGDWIILDKEGRDGKTLDGLGGIGAILRYKLQL